MNQISPRNRLLPPSWAYPFGTDNLGRDMLSRCLYGAQISVIIAFTAATLATVVSVAIGILSGYLGGKIDLDHAALCRCLDELSGLSSSCWSSSLCSARACRRSSSRSDCCFGIAGSRIIRSAVVSVRENMYVHAAQSIGASTAPHPVAAHSAEHHAADHRAVHDAGRHRHPCRVRACRSSASAFRRRPRPGAGCCRDRAAPSCSRGRGWRWRRASALTVVVYATNVFGDALRDLLDPRMRGSR